MSKNEIETYVLVQEPLSNERLCLYFIFNKKIQFGINLIATKKPKFSIQK